MEIYITLPEMKIAMNLLDDSAGIKTWIARGYINPKDKNPGRGKPRRFTWTEVVKIVALMILGSNGAGPKINVKVADFIELRAKSKQFKYWLPQTSDDFLKRGKILIYGTIENGVDGLKFVKAENISSVLSMGFSGSYFLADEFISGIAELIVLKIKRYWIAYNRDLGEQHKHRSPFSFADFSNPEQLVEDLHSNSAWPTKAKP